MIHRGIKRYWWIIQFLIFASFLFAQETHNLEIIWQRAAPDSVFYFGRCIASGDVNGDRFSDIMIVGDSVLHSPNPDSFYQGVCWVYLSGPNPDTILDIRRKCTKVHARSKNILERNKSGYLFFKTR